MTTGATLLDGGIYRLVSEGLFPHPGELWRLDGAFDANGVLQATACTGSHQIPDPPAIPAITVAGRTLRPAGATLAGVTHVAAPTVRVASRTLTLRSSLPLVECAACVARARPARAGCGISACRAAPAGSSSTPATASTRSACSPSSPTDSGRRACGRAATARRSR